MKKLVRKALTNQKGLTLIELLAVVVILGIIAAIAVPMIGNIISDSRDKAFASEALNVISSAKVAQASGEGSSFADNEALSRYITTNSVTFTNLHFDEDENEWVFESLTDSNSQVTNGSITGSDVSESDLSTFAQGNVS